MELDFFDFAKFLFDTHFSEDIKLKDYIENTYKPTDIILYLKYSNYKKLSSNYLLMNLIYAFGKNTRDFNHGMNCHYIC
ncbi:hypothetical protein ACV3UL_18490 [Clostridium perfringens]